MSALRDAALSQVELGRAVFPCHWQTKRPLVARGFKEATCDRNVVARWWTRWPAAMIGMPTGAASGVWVLDVDDPALFAANCPVELPATRRCETGKGYHLYWRWTADVRSRARNKGRWPYAEIPGTETRGAGGYVILPPSVHPSGRVYRWSCMGEPLTAPVELLRIVQQPTRRRVVSLASATPAAGDDSAYGLAALDRECAAIRTAPDGSQECTLTWAAFRMGCLVAEGKLSSGTARDRLSRAGRSMPSYNDRDPWTAELVAAKIADRLRAGMGGFR